MIDVDPDTVGLTCVFLSSTDFKHGRGLKLTENVWVHLKVEKLFIYWKCPKGAKNWFFDDLSI